MIDSDNKLIITPVTQVQSEKIRKDLAFINLLTSTAKEEGMRAIVHGGYAVDGFFGKVTRPHGDIDLGIWGNGVDAMAIMSKLLTVAGSKDKRFASLTIEDHGRNDWTHTIYAIAPDFRAEMYYAQVMSDPFSPEKHIVKSDGTVVDQLHSTQMVSLEDFTFETCTPLQSIVDRLYKQKRGDGIKAHHTQDIENLRLITDAQVVQDRLENYTGG